MAGIIRCICLNNVVSVINTDDKCRLASLNPYQPLHRLEGIYISHQLCRGRIRPFESKYFIRLLPYATT